MLSLPGNALDVAKGMVVTGHAIMQDLEKTLGCSDADSEKEFYNRIRTLLATFYPNYANGAERVAISVTGMRPVVEIRVLDSGSGALVASSRANYSWDDLPDKVRKALITNKKYEEVISGGVS